MPIRYKVGEMLEQDQQEKSVYRILSLDGGGVRGLYTAELLKVLAQRFARSNGRDDRNLDIGGAFDLIVGTSTGAILGVALAAGIPIDKIITMYKEKASLIFQKPTKNKNKIKNFAVMLYVLFRCANSPEPLLKALQEVFGNTVLADIYKDRKISLCVPTIDAQTLQPWVYKTPHLPRLTRDHQYSLVDVCMSSASAPIIFPLHGVDSPENKDIKNWFIDGGLWANNPSLIGLIEALEILESSGKKNTKIQIISVGTCPAGEIDNININNHKRGFWKWGKGIGIVDASMRAQSSGMHHITKFLSARLNVEYIRLKDPAVSSKDTHLFELDNPSEEALNRLMFYAHQSADDNISEATTGNKPLALLEEIFKQIKPL